jgi:AraC-like DNA-binding protein
VDLSRHHSNPCPEMAGAAGDPSAVGVRPLAPFIEHAASARAILAGFAALGLDAEAIRSAAGITVQLEPLGAIPHGTVAALWDEAFVLAPREELPTEVGLAVPFGAFGVVDIMAGASEDLASAIRAVAEHFGWMADGVRLGYQWTSDKGLLSIHHVRGHLDVPRQRQIMDEFILAGLVDRFSKHVGERFQVLEVRLTRPRPSHATRHQELLAAPIAFACPLAELVIAGRCRELRVRTANALVVDAIRQIAPANPGAKDPSLESAVRMWLGASSGKGSEGAAAVARWLGVSERTLRRRLRAAGLRYRDVLARFRETEAERLLSVEELRLSRVATQLGFHDSSTLSRAFRRWKGMSPGRWRRAPSS